MGRQSSSSSSDAEEEEYASGGDEEMAVQQSSDDDAMSCSDDDAKPNKKSSKTPAKTPKPSAKAAAIPTPTPIRFSQPFTTPSITKKRTLGVRHIPSAMTPLTTTKSMSFTTPTQRTPLTHIGAGSNMKSILAARRKAAELEMAELSRGEENTEAMLQNKLSLRREPLIGELSVVGAEEVKSEQIGRTFAAPRQEVKKMTSAAIELVSSRTHVGRRLGIRMRFGGVGVNKPFTLTADDVDLTQTGAAIPNLPASAITKPVADDFQPLVIWQPTEEELAADSTMAPIVVDEFLARKLRPHQREGVLFMAECVLELKSFKGAGCILADDMGLGKTCMSVTLLYTLLRYGFHAGVPTAKRVIVVCPTSLVKNWKNEVAKWVGDAINVIALSENSKDSIDRGIADFLNPVTNAMRKAAHVLVLSYDTYRRRHRKFLKEGSCDLLICDEAHRLKNAETAIYKTLDKLPCKRRVLLSGTPLQNDLSEFYAMVNFINPNVLGDQRIFHSYYEHPILMGREPDAIDEERKKGSERAIELSAIVNQFVLRRTNALLSAHLPPKVMQVICCRPTELQKSIYKYISTSKVARSIRESGEDSERRGGGGPGTGVLPLIGNLRALCNHPKLVFDGNKDQKLLSVYPKEFLANPIDPRWSGKMHVLDQLLASVKQYTDDRWVIVSNFTTTLDLMEQICKSRKWGCLRLDGSTSVKKRQELVDQLGDRKNDIYVFLLSSKAGGCGLNMIGANRLVLFDPDWNPAVDQQAAARVWRDGQTKRCFIYRFVMTGSIDEKIYQRQLTKEGLKSAIGSSAAADNDVSMLELKDLFDLIDEQTCPLSDTHDTLECSCSTDLVGTTKRERKFRVRKPAKGQQQTDSGKKQAKSKKGADSGSGTGSGSDNDDTLKSDAEGSDNNSQLPSSASKLSKSDASDKENENTATKPDAMAAPQLLKLTSPSKAAASASATDLAVSERYLTPGWLRKAAIGQRGEPVDTELINWAHHVSILSAPDPMLRKSYARIKIEDSKPDEDAVGVDKITAEIGKLWVSFVFSCEVRGKPLSTEAEAEAKRVSAICDIPPVQIKRIEQATISAADAEQRKKEFIERKTKKAKKDDTPASGDEDDTVAATPSKGKPAAKANKQQPAAKASKKAAAPATSTEESPSNSSEEADANVVSGSDVEEIEADDNNDRKQPTQSSKQQSHVKPKPVTAVVSGSDSSSDNDFESATPAPKATKPATKVVSDDAKVLVATTSSGRARKQPLNAEDQKILSEAGITMAVVASMDEATRQMTLQMLKEDQSQGKASNKRVSKPNKATEKPVKPTSKPAEPKTNKPVSKPPSQPPASQPKVSVVDADDGLGFDDIL